MIIDLKAQLSTADDGKISAMAWPFGKADRVGDIILPGAFKSASAPIPMLAFHDFNSPIGVWTEITEKADGLHMQGEVLINDVSRAREMFALVQRKAVSAVSIGFKTIKAKPLKGGGREISQLELLECSLVSIGMNPGARVTSAKSAIEAIAVAMAIHRATMALTRTSR